MSSDKEVSVKERAIWFLGGVILAFIGLSIISLGLYSATTVPEIKPWRLQHYFQLVFGIAGAIVGFLTTIVGAAFSLVSLDRERPDSE